MATETDVLRNHLEAVRAHTRALVDGLDDALFRARTSDAWSPLGWHLGHIAFTEARFLLERAHGEDDLTRPHIRVFSQEESEKARRSETIPPAETIRAYVDTVRARVLERLDDADPASIRLVIGHECQHAEILAVVLQGLGPPKRQAPWPGRETPGVAAAEEAWRSPVDLPGGHFVLGDEDDPWAYDNELPGATVQTAAFRMAQTPVTCGAWRRFMADGGYRSRALWGEAGWAWRESLGISRPASWSEDGTQIRTPVRRMPFDPRLPVHGISCHEAEAFARWAGGRLPTEAEWERAAAFGSGGARRRFPWGDAEPGPDRCNAQLWYGGPAPVGAVSGEAATRGLHDLAGQVWEWTATPFAPRPGFAPGPYPGYSARYFDGEHRVLKGGSFASVGAILRCAFRNWYTKESRDLFAGMRLAWDGSDD
jgi:gamma-glutamyl hercynylcysteine S-oxide synthase